MKLQEVILPAMEKQDTWWQAAEIIGISDRHVRRWRERYKDFGYDGLFDRPPWEAFAQASAAWCGRVRVGGSFHGSDSRHCFLRLVLRI